MDVLNFRNVKQMVLPSGENVRRIADVNDNTLWLGYVKIEYYTVANVTQKVKTEEILYGEDGTPPVVPERIGDYYANTWDPPCKNVMTDITAYNVYTLKYSATFKNRVTGAVLSSALYLPGQSVTYPGNPSKQYYTFTGWTPESVPDIQENTTIFAEFSHNEIVVDTIERSFSYDEQQHQFVVTGHLNNGTGTPRVTYSLDQVNWTETPYQRSARNTKLLVYYRLEYENYEAYTSSAYLEIDEGEKFQVTFYYRDGDDNPQTYTDEVLYGLGATAPTVTGSNAWVFDGWDKDFSHVTSDLDVTA